MTNRPRLMVLALSALAVAGTACAATPHATESIGLRRVGLSLAFKDEKLKKAVPPRILVQVLPAPPELSSQPIPDFKPYIDTSAPPPSRPAVPLPSLPSCQKAKPGATPGAQAPIAIPKPPTAGKYLLFNEGTIKATVTGVDLTLPYPVITVMEIRNVQVTQQQSPLPPAPEQGPFPAPPAGLSGSGPVTTFDMVETLTPTNTVTETYRYDYAALYLVSRTVTNGPNSSTITPAPPVEVYDFKGVGTSWNSLAADTATHKAVATHGTTTSTRVIDACGTLVDTQEVTSDTTVADPGGGAVTGTQTGRSDVFDIATGLGGLFARRELHTTDVQQINGTQVNVTYDVVSTLGTLEPLP